MDSDILIEIPDVELKQLRDVYENFEAAPYVYSFINTAIRWKTTRPDKKYMTFYAPQGDWRSDGTFIAHMQFSFNDFFVFTLDVRCEQLIDSLIATKRFDWNRPWLFYAVHRLHVDAVNKALAALNVVPQHSTVTDIYAIDKTDALHADLKLPDDVYLKKLTIDDARIVDDEWPHKHDGSLKLIEMLIELNGGYGIYAKETDELCSWVIKNQMGTMSMLQTAEKFKRKGYGSLATKAIAKEIASDGHVPLGTVLCSNFRSQRMFQKLGYRIIDQATYIVNHGAE